MKGKVDIDAIRKYSAEAHKKLAQIEEQLAILEEERKSQRIKITKKSIARKFGISPSYTEAIINRRERR